MYPVITSEKQKEFEKLCVSKHIAGTEDACSVPTICGYYGRACRQMGDRADRVLCWGCALAKFSKGTN